MTPRAEASRQVSILIALLLLLTVAPAFAQPPAPSPPSEPLPATPPGSFPTPTAPSDLPTTTGPPRPYEPLLAPPAGTIPSVAPPADPIASTAEMAPTARLEFHPSLRLFEDYTDNFLLTARHKQDDFRTGVGPALTVLVNQAFLKGGLTAAVAETHDSATDSLNTFYSLNGRLTWQATPRWSLSLSDTLSRTDEPAAADRLGLRQERRTFVANALAVASTYSFDLITTEQHYTLSTFFDQGSRGTTSQIAGGSATARFLQTNRATLGYNYSSSTTSRNGSDITGHQAMASLARQLSSAASAGLAGNYLISDVTGGPSGSNSFRLWTASVFNRYTLPGRWWTEGNLGYTRLIPERGKERGGLFSASSLGYQFARAVATVAVDRGFSPTYSYGQNEGLVDTFGVTTSLSVRVTPSLVATVGGFYRQNTFTGIASTAQGDTTTWGGNLNLSMQVSRWLAASVSYSYRVFTPTVSASPARGDVAENRIRLSLSASY